MLPVRAGSVLARSYCKERSRWPGVWRSDDGCKVELIAIERGGITCQVFKVSRSGRFLGEVRTVEELRKLVYFSVRSRRGARLISR
jgi:hypothetical protein